MPSQPPASPFSPAPHGLRRRKTEALRKGHRTGGARPVVCSIVQQKPWPDFARGERLLLESIRSWLHSPSNWNQVHKNFLDVFGTAAGRRAIGDLKDFLETLNAGARRPISFGAVAARETTADERTLLALIAAHQTDQPPRAYDHAAWLVRKDWVFVLAVEAKALADAFQQHGMTFSYLVRARPAARATR